MRRANKQSTEVSQQISHLIKDDNDSTEPSIARYLYIESEVRRLNQSANRLLAQWVLVYCNIL